MSLIDTTHFGLHPRHITLSAQSGEEVVVQIGLSHLVGAIFRHTPPTPSEMEHAIEVVEDALMASRLRHADRGELLTSDATLRGLPGLNAEGSSLTRDDVEALFQRLASASLGHPGAMGEIPADGETAAALLILRECMQHLGYVSVRLQSSSSTSKLVRG